MATGRSWSRLRASLGAGGEVTSDPASLFTAKKRRRWSVVLAELARLVLSGAFALGFSYVNGSLPARFLIYSLWLLHVLVEDVRRSLRSHGVWPATAWDVVDLLLIALSGWMLWAYTSFSGVAQNIVSSWVLR